MCAAAILGSFEPALAATPPAAPPPAKAELLVDVGTGRVLYAHNDHVPLPPGSLTKVLTAMIAADWLPPNALVPVSRVAANASPDRVGMKPGQTWPLGITLHTLLIWSANDAAYALAERVSGSLQRFVATMQLAAGEIGMRDHPLLRDPAGLDGTEGFESGNRISAWDLAVAARDMMANPELARIAGLKNFWFTAPGGTIYNIFSHNLAFLNSYAGAIGVKTGYTDQAGVCVIEEAERGGRRMLAVVLNGVSPDQTAGLLLDRGFRTPARAETSSDPELPPIVEPEPVPTGPKRIREIVGGDPPAVAASVAAPSGQSLANSYALETGAGTAAVVVVLLAIRRHRRKRREPIGVHSFRRPTPD